MRQEILGDGDGDGDDDGDGDGDDDGSAHITGLDITGLAFLHRP